MIIHFHVISFESLRWVYLSKSQDISELIAKVHYHISRFRVDFPHNFFQNFQPFSRIVSYSFDFSLVTDLYEAAVVTDCGRKCFHQESSKNSLKPDHLRWLVVSVGNENRQYNSVECAGTTTSPTHTMWETAKRIERCINASLKSI